MSKKTTDSTKAQVHVHSLRDMGNRFISAWKRAEKGVPVNETHITFLDIDAMVSTMSPRRLELLRYVRQNEVNNTRELDAAIGRHYKNVHQDVAALEAVGLLVLDGRKLSAPWDEVRKRRRVGSIPARTGGLGCGPAGTRCAEACAVLALATRAVASTARCSWVAGLCRRLAGFGLLALGSRLLAAGRVGCLVGTARRGFRHRCGARLDLGHGSTCGQQGCHGEVGQ